MQQRGPGGADGGDFDVLAAPATCQGQGGTVLPPLGLIPDPRGAPLEPRLGRRTRSAWVRCSTTAHATTFMLGRRPTCCTNPAALRRSTTRAAPASSLCVGRSGGSPARFTGVAESARLRPRYAGLGDRGGEAGIKPGAFPVSAARLTGSGARAPLSAPGTSRRMVEADRDRLARPIPPIAASTIVKVAASQPQRGCQLAWRVRRRTQGVGRLHCRWSAGNRR
eukprot:3670901-Prymnesium_polylepis.2